MSYFKIPNCNITYNNPTAILPAAKEPLASDIYLRSNKTYTLEPNKLTIISFDHTIALDLQTESNLSDQVFLNVELNPNLEKAGITIQSFKGDDENHYTVILANSTNTIIKIVPRQMIVTINFCFKLLVKPVYIQTSDAPVIFLDMEPEHSKKQVQKTECDIPPVRELTPPSTYYVIEKQKLLKH
jgi:hypothetical protein